MESSYRYILDQQANSTEPPSCIRLLKKTPFPDFHHWWPVCLVSHFSSPPLAHCLQLTPSGTVWPQLDRRGKEWRELSTWFTFWSKKAESLGIDFPCLSHLLAGKLTRLLTEMPINLICQNKTTLGTIPITELAHCNKTITSGALFSTRFNYFYWHSLVLIAT